jgi:hypothetical protein
MGVGGQGILSMISEATARRRTLLAIAACVAVAAVVANQWVKWIYPSFTGGAYSDFKFFPHGLFLPASLVAFVLGASDPMFRQLLFLEALLICFVTFISIYGVIAYVFRRDNA